MSAVARKQERAFLGTGWKFPLQVNSRGGIAVTRQEQHVEESIFMILATSPGERVMLPEFGCGIHDLVFMPNNATTLSLVTDLVRKALVTHEPRIDVLQVNSETSAQEPNLLLIRVDYRIRSNNTMANLVYPFYVSEGT